MNSKDLPKELHLKVDQNAKKAPNYLSEHIDLSIGDIKSCMQKGAVWLTDKTGTHRLRRASKKLSIGDELHFYFNPTVINSTIREPVLVHDADHYSIWIKPTGVLSQGSKWGDHCSITRWIELNDKNQRPTFIVHRLDRAACGLMLIAHGKKMASVFSAMFAKRQISKRYFAYVNGDHSAQTTPQTINDKLDDKISITHITHINFDEDSGISRFDINIETGRKHQIRKHLGAIGCHIINDRLYGTAASTAALKPEDNLQLYAVSLEFECPINHSIESFQLPTDFLPNHSPPSTDNKIIDPPMTV